VKFEEEIKNIQAKLKEKDETEQPKKKDKGEDQKTNKNKEAEFSNPITILKRRLAKIIATNHEKRHLIDRYIRNVKVIEDAFK